jgi:hypothetical protein
VCRFRNDRLFSVCQPCRAVPSRWSIRETSLRMRGIKRGDEIRCASILSC